MNSVIRASVLFVESRHTEFTRRCSISYIWNGTDPKDVEDFSAKARAPLIRMRQTHMWEIYFWPFTITKSGSTRGERIAQILSSNDSISPLRA